MLTKKSMSNKKNDSQNTIHCGFWKHLNDIFLSVFLLFSFRHHNNKAIIIFEGVLETTSRWYLVAICPRNFPSRGGIPSLTSHPPWGLCLWSTSLLCDTSKQWGPGLGAHILPAVPAGPVKTQHTDKCVSTYVARGDENTERGEARTRACWDNAPPPVSSKLYAVIEQQLSVTFSSYLVYILIYYLTSLSKLSICKIWIARSRLVWWNGSPMLRNLSRSLRLREFSTRPSTRWVWKVCEYWGSPMSLSHDVATQWWSMSEALESLEDD